MLGRAGFDSEFLRQGFHAEDSAAGLAREGFHAEDSVGGLLRECSHAEDSAAGLVREGLIPGHLRKGVGFRDLFSAVRGGWGAPDLIRNASAKASTRKIAPQD